MTNDNTNSPTLFLTYTCPVSRFTFAGHPRSGHLYEHTNDLPDAVDRIKRIASSHGQPVSWVINDQEYLNLEGLLPRLLEWQKGGDSILVTMELTTSPAEVDKTDTQAVICWIAGKCSEAGLVPDGLWSLKFYESDLKALRDLPREEFPWTRNLAGSCWHQEGIDDSTWLGCPFGPYYPAVWNAKAPSQSGGPQEFLMLEWLTRDVQACLNGGFPATFSLDPADANRYDAGGFDTEKDALRYSIALIEEAGRQVAFNSTVVVNINEEARHYQTEGHDKDYMLEGMFGRFSGIANDPPAGVRVVQAPYGQVWQEFRQRHEETPEGVFLFKDLDWRPRPVHGGGEQYNNRVPHDHAVLYQSPSAQMGFLRSRGPLPVERYDYSKRHPGNDENEPYPQTQTPPLQLHERVMNADGGEVSVSMTIFAPEFVSDAGVMVWDAPVKGNEAVKFTSECVMSARPTPSGLLVVLELCEGINKAEIVLEKA